MVCNLWSVICGFLSLGLGLYVGFVKYRNSEKGTGSRDSVSEGSGSESNNKSSLGKEGKRCGFNFVGCTLLDSLGLNLS